MIQQIIEIEVDSLQANPLQPRGVINPESLVDLVDSIKEHGVLEPLVVAKTPAGYQIIAGERRWRAAKLAGHKVIPAIIKETTPQGMLEMAIVENVQRTDLNPLDRAKAFERLITEFVLTNSEISQRIGKSPAYVSNTLRLLSLPDALKDGLLTGLITEGHARAILAVDDPKNKSALLAKVIRDGISVHEAESFSQKLRIWQPTRRTRGNLHEEKALEDKARSVFGMQSIRLKLESGQPRLTILLDSIKDLEDLFKRIT